LPPLLVALLDEKKRPWPSSPPVLKHTNSPSLLLLLISLSQMHLRIPQILPLPKDQKLKNKIKSISDPKKIVAAKPEEPHKGSDLENP
jgi:hypothetical protein